MKIDINKPVELYNPITGETRDTTLTVAQLGTFKSSVGVTQRGWVNYNEDGSAYMITNPWTVRNKAEGLDLSKPLELSDGTLAELTYIYSPKSDETYWKNYIDVSINGILRSFSRNTLTHHAFPGLTLRNKEIKMLDLNKPLVVGGKDAKVIHKFDNGNLAVVVDGETDVLTFSTTGAPVGRTNFAKILKNKVVETVRYVNVYPDASSPYQVYKHDSLTNAVANISSAGFCVKQTLIDGKVVKNELVS